eukprot:NODE_2614_length_1379_cov_72.352707_g2485_i0.p1 GENE.NODE_2614_length_1379_cov_72.352707_g2485_i0~~NODE_2614_length_1379_cov_72.352707_g2485_i0.p1  ORF type:complete len:414 (-),score=69.86 NODE_2614_length_1379_cov_72.352707_g2485_i0:76-1317(-)
MGKKRVGGKTRKKAQRKKNRKALALHRAQRQDEPTDVPRTFVLARGVVGRSVAILSKDLRKMMLPHTALKIKARKSNKLKDIKELCSSLDISHVQILTCGDAGTNFRIVRMPQGPSVSFRVQSFESTRDVISRQKKHYDNIRSYDAPALPILNNFAGSPHQHIQMVEAMITSMFPALQVDGIKLSQCKRVVLFHLNKESGVIDVRHYLIKSYRSGGSRAVRKLSKGRLPRKISYLKDIGDLLSKEDYFSESDSEAEAEETILPQDFQGQKADDKAKIRLMELGPRMSMQVHSIINGFPDGEVLYNAFVTKTPEEIERLKVKAREKQKKLDKARATTSKAIAEKEAKKEEKRRKKQERKARKQGSNAEPDGDQPQEGAGGADGEGPAEDPDEERVLFDYDSDVSEPDAKRQRTD